MNNKVPFDIHNIIDCFIRSAIQLPQRIRYGLAIAIVDREIPGCRVFLGFVRGIGDGGSGDGAVTSTTMSCSTLCPGRHIAHCLSDVVRPATDREPFVQTLLCREPYK